MALFEKLHTQEHLVLLKLFHSQEILFNERSYLTSLERKTLVSKKDLMNGETVIGFKYVINSRGVAFIHQQRDPADISKLEKASMGFINKLHKIICLNQATDKLTTSLFGTKEEKHNVLQSLDKGLKELKQELNEPDSVANPLEVVLEESN